MKRTNTIDFWRVIFIFAILIFHFFDSFPRTLELHDLKNGWRIGVEFFFIVGGYLLAKKENSKPTTPASFFYHRFLRLYPEFFLMMIAYFPIFFGLNHLTIKQAIKELLENLDDFLLINGTYANVNTLNGSMWYLSCMLLGGYIVYYLYHTHKHTFLHWWGPIIVALGYVCLFEEVGVLGNYNLVIHPFYISVGLLRAILGQTLGIYVFYLAKKLGELPFTKLAQICFRIVEPLLYIAVLSYSMKEGSTRADYSLLILLFAAISISFSGITVNRFYGNRIVSWLSSISFAMYLNHIIVRNILSRYLDTSADQLGILPVYLVICLVVAVVMHSIYLLLSKGYKKLKPTLKHLFLNPSSSTIQD